MMFGEYMHLVRSSDWPEYVETLHPIYAPEEIWAMLQVATLDEAILLKFFLASGFRKDEVRYTTWYDVDFHDSLVCVTANPFGDSSPRVMKSESFPCPRQ